MELLTIDECADFTKLTPDGIRHLVYKKKIPYIKKTKRVLFEKSRVEQWLREGEVADVKTSF